MPAATRFLATYLPCKQRCDRLCGVFAGEGAAAVPGDAAVGIDKQFAAG